MELRLRPLVSWSFYKTTINEMNRKNPVKNRWDSLCTHTLYATHTYTHNNTQL